MKKLNVKGFELSQILAITGILAVVGGTAFYVYRVNHPETKETVSKNIQEEPKEKSEKEHNTELQIYNSDDPIFSFKYPLGWKLNEQNTDGYVTLTLRSPDYKESASENCPKLINGYGFTVSYSKEAADKNIIKNTLEKSGKDGSFVKNARKSGLGEKEAVRYSKSPGECGEWEVTSAYYDGFNVSVFSTLGHGLGEYEDEYASVVSSFEF